MDTETNTSEPAKAEEPSLELEEISLDVGGTSGLAGATPLSTSTDDPSAPNEQHDDSTTKTIALGETSPPDPPSPTPPATGEVTSTTPTPTKTAVKEIDSPAPSPCSVAEHRWLLPLYHDAQPTRIKTPEEIEKEGIPSPPSAELDATLLDRFRGSIVAMAIGDALGAHVEFRPRSYLEEHPVTDFSAGGTWGLKRGQFTDDTSMALCLAASLIEKGRMDPYDQLVKYKWWFRHGYMSSTGECFDIGAATSQSLCEFERRQRHFAEKHEIEEGKMDTLDLSVYPGQFDVNCSEDGVAGNGALMRLAPVPLFFFLDPRQAIVNAGQSGQITHGDVKARDACRYYAALIVAALHGCDKERLLSKHFYPANRHLFGTDDLVPEIKKIANGSFRKKGGYEAGIRGKGYIVPALEAALWAFWSTTTFEEGALAAVNLGDDTDTTAAIYGQLAGAFYGYARLDGKWKGEVYGKGFLQRISEWLLHRGTHWKGNDGEQERLVIDFPIDANEGEGTAAAQITVQPPPPSPPPAAATPADVPVSPVHTPEEQPAVSVPVAVPVPATPSEQSSTGVEQGTEQTTPPPAPSAEGAPSAHDAANEPVQAVADVSVPSPAHPADGTAQPEQVTEEQATPPPPPPPPAAPVAPPAEAQPAAVPAETTSAPEAVAPPAAEPPAEV